jgi:kinesin family protein 5
MNGYNGTILAYGQTGSGKTFTMMGDIEHPELKGLSPRTIEAIFANIHASPSHIEFTVKCSFIEIYMERVKDLLNRIIAHLACNDNLPIHEDKVRGIYVKGLLEVFVSSVSDVYEVMRRGNSIRSVDATC